MSGCFISVIMYVGKIFDETRDVTIGVGYFLKLIPSILFGNAILDVTNVRFYAILQGDDTNNIPYYSWKYWGQNVFYLTFPCIFFLALLIALEIDFFKPLKLCFIKKF